MDNILEPILQINFNENKIKELLLKLLKEDDEIRNAIVGVLKVDVLNIPQPVNQIDEAIAKDKIKVEEDDQYITIVNKISPDTLVSLLSSKTCGKVIINTIQQDVLQNNVTRQAMNAST